MGACPFEIGTTTVSKQSDGRTQIAHPPLEMLLHAILDVIQIEFAKPPPSWRMSAICPEQDMDFFKKECSAPSEFDPAQLRKAMMDGLQHGTSQMTVATSPYGTIHAVYRDAEQYHDIPWELWGRILRMYSDKQSRQKPFKIFFLASDMVREFPAATKPITPLHINGGYTYHCNRETIMIYKAEDATRVLLHELMHACCLDNMSHGVDQIEAETEAWAELLYVGFLSQGHSRRFSELLKRQAAWIRMQNEKVRRHMKSPMAFPWRYTVGKEEVWARWGILPFPAAVVPSVSIGQSLRLTCPPESAYKKRFKVRVHSTIL